MLKKLLIISLSIFMLIVLAISIYVHNSFKKVKVIKMPSSNAELGISNAAGNDVYDELDELNANNVKKNTNLNEIGNSQITNIALFGLDRRNVDDASRSDCIMILSMDEAAKAIKISSIMRDTYVSVYNHGMTKITHAYAYGGPALAVRTINENFGLDIRDFVTVDFFQLEKLIDILGGVTVNVMPDEIQELNENMSETANIEKKSFSPIKVTGTQVLNGMQAVAYCRIRYTVGDDYRRTERQRDVMQCILEKLFKVDVSKYPEVIANLLPYVETSLNSSKILKLGMDVYTAGMHNIEKQRFPLDKCSRGATIDGIWYLVTNIDATKSQMHKFIYENKTP
jgi:polyisoprenyl-teichoic acid--peptidoglycan teichoic acid transferase